LLFEAVRSTNTRRRTDMDRSHELRYAVLVTGGELSGYVQKAYVPKPVALAAMEQLVRDGLAAVIVPMQHKEGIWRIAECRH
jgi:hypothetical protein